MEMKTVFQRNQIFPGLKINIICVSESVSDGFKPGGTGERTRYENKTTEETNCAFGKMTHFMLKQIDERAQLKTQYAVLH